MAVPASDLWAKIQKELSGKGNLEQLAILQRYLDAWPDEWKGPYQELKARLTKLVRKLQTIESVKSSGARDDPFHVPRGGDAQIGFIGLTNSGRSALVSTLTHARLEVSDYPFTTHVPAPGMLRHQDAALQLVDTPAVVPGLAQGAGPGQRLVQLIRTMDAVAVVIDLARDPLEQVGVIHSELAAAKVLLRPGPVDVMLALKGKGGITFRGTAITKAERSVAARLLAEHGIVHAEVVVRRQFVADDLAAQLVGTRLLPALIVGSKNDVPGAGNALTLLRAQYDAYTVIDVNFLDAANFEQLKTSLFDVLGAVRVFVLDRPDADAARTTLIVPRASSVADLIARRWPGRTTQAAVARVWGPSAKYPGQPVGLEHLVADGDSVYLQL